jgi:Excalibur calcium-binding domain
MLRTSFTVTAVASLALVASAVAAAPPNKCVVNGSVTFQQGPCPSDQVRKPPTIQELNAEEKKRRAAKEGAASVKPASSAPAMSTGFRCDGRTHCSQMKSCAEAKYFLANCPRVTMDGDGDGTPCEQQWCSR